MELLNLQSSLQSEIAAKQAISDELRTSKAVMVATEKLVVMQIYIILYPVCYLIDVYCITKYPFSLIQWRGL